MDRDPLFPYRGTTRTRADQVGVVAKGDALCDVRHSDADGVRQFKEVLLVVARKNGKSKLASCVADYMWRECGGYGTRVYCIAPKLDQADIIYNDIWQMVTLDPEYKELKESLSERDAHNKKIL